MQYNDTSTGQGLIQSMEFWAGFNPTDISGDSELKEIFTNRLNRRLEQYLGMMGAGSRLSQVDDTNFTKQPFSTFTITDGQHDYEFLEDADGNAITDITAVMVKPTASGSFEKLEQLTLDYDNGPEDNAQLIMSPNSNPGVPTRFVERNNTIFLDPVPNFTLAGGGKLFYKRAPSYFVVADTTKEPGIPVQFHEMLAIASAYDWILVNGSNKRMQITRVERELQKWEREFRVYVQLRNPQRPQIKARVEDTR